MKKIFTLIDNLMNKILSIDIKGFIKKCIDKINFKKTTIALFIPFILSFIFILITKNLVFLIIFLISSFALLILGFLKWLRAIIDDINKIVFGIISTLIIVTSLTTIIIFLSKIAHWMVPIYYSDPEDDKIYDLIFNTYSGVIAAVIGIAGTYFGAVYGGKKSIEATKIQLEQQAKDNETIRKNNERFALKIISKLLSQEINNNFDILSKNSYFNKITINNANYYYSSIANELKFEIYNNTKYELIKYAENDSLVEEVIDVYGLLEIVTRYTNLKDMNKKDKGRVLHLKNKMTHLIDSIESITFESTN